MDEKLQHLAIHKVGNKGNNDLLFLTKKSVTLNHDMQLLLTDYFLNAFSSEEYYQFQHDSDLALNEVFNYATQIFDNPKVFQEVSIHIAQHLYNQSLHPKIKSGEFYVVYFKDCFTDGQIVDAIGLYKSENKDTFLEIEQTDEGFDIDSKQGVNINKIDKGCLIYNLIKEDGYKVAIVDNINKSLEAQYWKDDFLNVLVVNNHYHQTNQFLTLTKQFVTKQLEEDFEISKADKIDLLNRSVDYFKKHEQFDKQEFEEEVFHHDNIIQSFRQFDQSFKNEFDIEIEDNFFISEQAVKKQARVFKSVIKLDKNFHIYIHGNREMIEQGVDENGRKFYKIYYDSES
ncbi:MAG: nucleoid-associated protein [Bacteroidetes bacterium]|nr:nucleoid-associated protein [Bacteroidota bacterium]